jgi:hypothetical protein
MKTGIVSLLVFLLAADSSLAQGTINFNTRIPEAGLDAPVTISIFGEGPGPAYSAGLFLLNDGVLRLISDSVTTFSDGTANPQLAKYIDPVIVEIPGIPAGSSATLHMRAWLTGAGSYEATISDSVTMFLMEFPCVLVTRG